MIDEKHTKKEIAIWGKTSKENNRKQEELRKEKRIEKLIRE